MRNAIILHGLVGKKEYYNEKSPSGSNYHWLPWLQKQLMIHDIKADTPEVPRPFDFAYRSWVNEVERFDMSPETTLVGHSMGGGFWMRYLSEHSELFIDKVVLVAPWLDEKHRELTDFFDFDIDPAIVERTNEFIIFSSDDDGKRIQSSLALLQEKLPNATFRSFHGYGHFTVEAMGTAAFPELRDVIL